MTWLFGFLPHICRTPANDPEVQKDFEKVAKVCIHPQIQAFCERQKRKIHVSPCSGDAASPQVRPNHRPNLEPWSSLIGLG